MFPELLGTRIPETLRLELLWAQSFMLEDRPRVLYSGTDRKQKVDCFYRCVVRVALMISLTEKFFFSEKVQLISKPWQNTKITATLELFAAICMLLTRFQGWRIFAFIDNEAARSCLCIDKGCQGPRLQASRLHAIGKRQSAFVARWQRQSCSRLAGN